MSGRDIEIKNICEDLRWIWARYAPELTFIGFISNITLELAKKNKLFADDRHIVDVAREYYSSRGVVENKEEQEEQ